MRCPSPYRTYPDRVMRARVRSGESTTELLRRLFICTTKNKIALSAAWTYNERMRLFFSYMRWHFGPGFQELYQFWTNMAWFGYHFFSIPLLTHTLFRPLYRIHEVAPPGSGINIELFFENITVNFFARIIGFFLRVFLIACGGLYEFILLLLAPILFLLWGVLPFLPAIFAIIGIQLLF